MKKLLLTGGSGYIGSHLLSQLLEMEIQVIAVTRPETDLKKFPKHPALELYTHNGATEGIVRLIEEEKPDLVFHLAAVGSAEHTPEDIDPIIEANLQLGLQLLEGLRQAGCGSFVNTGTFWQHGDGSSAYQPTSLYAATKQAFEDILIYYVRAHQVPAVTLKLYDVYGHEDPRKRIISQLQEAQNSGKPLPLSPGEQQLDLVYIDDVVRGFLAAADWTSKNPGASGKSFCLSSDQRVSLRELVAIYSEVSGKTVPVQWGGRPYREREVMSPYVGERLPGWRPEVELREGIRLTIRKETL